MSVQKTSGSVFRPIGHSLARALLHRGFIGAGGVLLIAAFGTDYIYYTTAVWQWANFSAWLITAGLIVMLAAALLLLIDFATGRDHCCAFSAFPMRNAPSASPWRSARRV